MIFVFSGTGNSYHVAKRIALSVKTDMVDIAAAVRYKRFEYDAKGGDTGFVFPVYFMGMPSVVTEFVRNLKIRNPGRIYCVNTCGGSSGIASEQLQSELNGMKVSASYDVIMPDNAVFAFDPPSKEKAAEINKAADEIIGGIIDSVMQGKEGDFRTSAKKEGSEELYAKYEDFRITEPFGFDENCIECRICENSCPEQVIRVYHRKPVWDEEKCSLCMSCMNLCPKKSVQYGDKTAGRGRYFHPDYYLWSLGVNPPYKYEDLLKEQ